MRVSKRILAGVLSLALVVACTELSAAVSITEAETVSAAENTAMPIRLEAENQTLNRMQANTGWPSDKFSNNIVEYKPSYGGSWPDYSQVAETDFTGDSQIPYVAYKLTVGEAGTYKIRLGFVVNIGDQASTVLADYKMLVYVDGASYHASYYASYHASYLEFTSGYVVSASALEVELAAGENTLYCVSFDKTFALNNASIAVYQDYMDVIGKVESNSTRQEAEDQNTGNINQYDRRYVASWLTDAAKANAAGVGTVSSSAVYPSYEELNGAANETDLKQLKYPYVAYNVTTANAGVYKLKLGYVLAGTSDYSGHNMLVYVNGQAYRAPYTSTIADWSAYSEPEIDVLLKEGENTIYCVPFEKDYMSTNSKAWLVQDYLELGQQVTSFQEAEDLPAEQINIYGTEKITTWPQASGRAVIGNANSYDPQNLPTVTALNNGSFTEEQLVAVPYVAYKVTAAEDGTYRVKVGYVIGIEDTSKRDAHRMLLYVNGQVYEAPYTNSTRLDTGAHSESTAEIPLQKGENTIYCIPFDKEYRTANTGVWVNMDYLELGSKVSARQEAESQSEMNLNGDADTFWKDNTSGGAVVGFKDYKNADLPTLAELNDGTITETAMKKIPYVAYRVKVSAKGTYRMKVGYMIAGGTEANWPNHNVLVYVNGQAYRAPYTSTNANWKPYSESEIEVSLKAGENIVYCIPFEKGYKDTAGNDGAYVNMDYLELVGEVSARREAESQSEMNLNGNVDTTWKDNTSGGAVVGFKDYTNADLPTLAELNDGTITETDMKKIPYVAYRVNVAVKGTYRMKVGYMIAGGTEANWPNHNVLVYVNGQAYRAPYTSTNASWKPYSESEIEVSLKAGENIVYCIPFEKGYKDTAGNDGAYVNMDYLELVGEVSARWEAESQSEMNLNGNADTTWKGNTSGGAVVGFKDYTNADLPTLAELNDGTITETAMKKIPYVAYRVKVSAKGTYRMKVGYMIAGGTEANWPNHNVLVYVNGQAYRAPYTSTNASWKPYSESEIEVSLKAGENIVYCIPFEKGYKETDGNADAWVNMDYLELVGKVSARREAENQTLNCMQANTSWPSDKFSNNIVEYKPSYGGSWPDYTQVTETDFTGDSQIPYVAYKLTVGEAGTYKIRLGFVVNIGDQASTVLADYKMLVYVGGASYHASYHASHLDATSDYVVSASALEVELAAGENTLYCVSFDKTFAENNASIAVYQDYMDVIGKVESNSTRQEAEDQNTGNINQYNRRYDATWLTDAAKANAAGVGTVSSSAVYPSYEELNGAANETDLKHLKYPYVAYNVTTANAGVYKLKLGYVLADTSDYSGHNMLVYVNGQAYRAPYTSTNASWRAYSEPEIDVLLKEGENTIYCVPFEKGYMSTNSKAWLVQDYLELGQQVTGFQEAEDLPTEQINIYSTEKIKTWSQASGGAVIGNANNYDPQNLPTVTALNNGSFTEKQLKAVPYVAYKVTAAEDGTYRVKVGYLISGVNDIAAHRMLLYVNGQVYEAPYTNSTKLDTGAHSESTAEIPLQKGENTIYCIPFDKEYRTANTGVLVNMDYLELGSKVSARQEAESQSEMNLNLDANSTWADKTSGGAVVGFAGYKNADLPTCEELNDGSFTQLDMKNVPYIAYHVKVSAKGTYRMKVGYMIVGGTEAKHNILVYVNGQAYRAPYTSTNTEWQPYSESEIEVSLKAGENIVYCIPFEKGYKDTAGNAGAWVNMDYLELVGKVSARREAEDQRLINMYNNHADYGWIQSGMVLVSEAGSYANLPTITALNSGSFCESDLANVPYVAYKVAAEEDGTYRVKVGYVIGDVDTSKRATHRMLLYVNGQVYEAPYQDSGKLDTGAHSESTAEIPLQKGENTIYCIPFDKDYRAANTSGWLNQDYLELGSKVSARQEAESQSEMNLNGNADDTWAAKTSGGAVMGFKDYENADLPTLAELNDGIITETDMKKIPYVAYRVNVAVKGTYRMKVGYMIAEGTEANWPNHNVLVYVNGQAYRAPYTSTNANWKPYSESEIEVSLKAGENIVYCIPFEKGYKETAGNAKAWVNMDYLELGKMTSYEYYLEASPILESEGGRLSYAALQSGTVTPQFDEDAYAAYAIWAPEAGTYSIAVRTVFGNTNDDQEAYNTYVNANGKAYIAVVVNGTVYQAYLPSGAVMGKASNTKLTVTLQEGVNFIQSLDVVTEIAGALEGAYCRQECLKIPEGLTTVGLDAVLIQGDANLDRKVDIKDWVHAKKAIKMSKKSVASVKAVDFNGDGKFEASDMDGMRCLMLGVIGGDGSRMIAKSLMNISSRTKNGSGIFYETTDASGLVASMSDLNTGEAKLDDHSGEMTNSYLKMDYRGVIEYLTSDNKDSNGKAYDDMKDDCVEIGFGYPFYPRIRKLSDGTYMMTYQNTQDYSGSIFVTKSTDLKNWEKRQVLFRAKSLGGKDKSAYATCDFIELQNGDILAVAQYNAGAEQFKSDASSGGLVIKRSTDKGKNWGKEQVIYVGVNWEPNLLQLDDGTIHCYLTNSAPAMEKYGYDERIRSTGAALLVSRDNGTTWTPNVTGSPYQAKRIMQTHVNTLNNYGTNKLNSVKIFNDQMPVGIQLNNGNLALACETKSYDVTTKKDCYKISVGISTDKWSKELGEAEAGPADKFVITNDSKALNGPYFDQFDSGEIILAASSIFYMGDETAHNFRLLGDCGVTDSDKGWWEGISVTDSHTLVHAIPYRYGSNRQDARDKIILRTYYLNHRINALKGTVAVDGMAKDWTNKTDALFAGSTSQAQVTLRAAHDSDYLYFLLDRLDNNLSKSDDNTEIYFSTDSGATRYKLTVSAAGSVALQKSTDGGSNYTTVGANVRAGMTISGDFDDVADDEGYLAEIAIPKSALTMDKSSAVYADVTLCNKDGSTAYSAERMFDLVTDGDLTKCGKIVLK